MKILESQISNYTSISEDKTTINPAETARYNSGDKLYGMSKLNQTLMKVSSQKRKFEKMWLKTVIASKKEQKKVASDLYV